MTELFSIGALEIRVWDIFDILIVAFLMFQIYRLLRGTIAFNIFIGVVLLYAIYWLVNLLEMSLLSMVLDKFVSWGVLMLIIIFQPEVRKFLLVLGNNTLRGRLNFLKSIFGRNFNLDAKENQAIINELVMACFNLAEQNLGALIVLKGKEDLSNIVNTGTYLDAKLGREILENIFVKNSPLHDGATIITSDRIVAARCILPVSEKISLFQGAGLRHRAGIGITEITDVGTLIISEETGEISIAKDGKIQKKVDKVQLYEFIDKHL